VNHKSTTTLPEPIVQLQRQLEQFRSTQPRRTRLPEPLWQAAVELARQHEIYPVAHPLRLDYMQLKKRLGGVPSRRRKPTKSSFVELIRPRSATMAEHHRVRVREWKHDACPVEGGHTAGLGRHAARLAGSRRMIQITAQMRVLVAIEPFDGRKYAPSIDMRSVFKTDSEIQALLRQKLSCPHLILRIT
jgi:hypothetical protein